MKMSVKEVFTITNFSHCYLVVPRPTLGLNRGDTLTYPMLITALFQFLPKGHRDPRNVVGFRSPAELLVEFEAGTF